MNRKVTFGNKEVFDTYSVLLDGPDPLEVVYDEGETDQLRLVFNFNLVESNHKSAGFSVEPMGEAASFKVDIIKGGRGRMPKMLPVADSTDSTLYIYASFQANLKGAITFSYTIFIEKRSDVDDIKKLKIEKTSSKKVRRSRGE